MLQTVITQKNKVKFFGSIANLEKSLTIHLSPELLNLAYNFDNHCQNFAFTLIKRKHYTDAKNGI